MTKGSRVLEKKVNETGYQKLHLATLSVDDSRLTQGAFVWDQSGIRIIGIMRESVCLAAILIPEYLDFHSGYSASRSRIARIYSRIYSYPGISQTNALLECL